jgi:heme exporter protein C
MAIANRATGLEQVQDKTISSGKKADLPVASLILGALSFVGMLISLWMIFIYAPTDAVQGPPQRIFYFHVPMAWLGMLSFVIMAVAGVVYLLKRDERWDILGRAASEVGIVFLTLAIILGSLWGRPIWGTWWTWDPKLTACLILWFMYVGYIMVHSYMGRTPESGRAAAVLALVGVVDVPIIYEATNWWRTLHPAAEIGVAGALPPSVTLTLMVALTTFTLLYCFMMIQLYQLVKMQTLAQRLRATVEYEIGE